MATRDDADNRFFTGSLAQGDRANKLFYERFGSFPPPPRDWKTLEDTSLWRDLVLQEIGDWEHRRLPDGGEIWVAGCGAVQAVEVALNFPNQRVLATDISEVALAFGASLAKQAGLTNLEIRRESMFDATYSRRFDLVISRGVIHHTANPPLALQKLAAALKPDGLLDLTVLNRGWEGWQMVIPFQKALRILGSIDPDDPQFEVDLRLGRELAVEAESINSFITRFREFFWQFKAPVEGDEIPEHYFSILGEPNMHTYSIASYDELCTSAGLTMLNHGAIDPAMAAFSWDLELAAAPAQRERYDALAQKDRWQMTNLLAPKQPRVLRFYVQHASCREPVKTDRQLCEEFLSRRFAKVATTALVHVRSDDPRGEIVGQRRDAFPAPATDAQVATILDAHDEARPIGETFRKLGIEGFRKLNVLRRRLTTPPCPYLRAT